MTITYYLYRIRSACDKESTLCRLGIVSFANKHANGISSFETHFFLATIVTQANLTVEPRSVQSDFCLESARKHLNDIFLSITNLSISLSLHFIIEARRVGSLVNPENRNSIPEPTYRGTVSK